MAPVALFAASLVITLAAIPAHAKRKTTVPPSYAWTATPPLGVIRPATIDTSEINYAQRFVPTMVSSAWANTGNYGAEGLNMIWVERLPRTEFYFVDPLRHWLPEELRSYKYYNTRIPMTLLGYSFGGGSEDNQDRLQGIFSGNAGPRIQIGAYLDYLYSKGSYNNQALKDFTYGFSGSYMGERYKMMVSYLVYNLLNKENGGITDDLYITDPAKVQGGQTSVNAKQIPTRLNDAHTRVKGLDLFFNNRYSLGFHRTERADTDTIDRVTFVPVTDLIYTLGVNTNSHLFTSRRTSADDPDFWSANYFVDGYTYDRSSYTRISNTLGVAMLEGFNKWVKIGLTAFATLDLKKVKLPDYSAYERTEGLTELPQAMPLAQYSRNELYIGARLSSEKGRLFTYDATGRLCLTGAPGAFDADGRLRFALPLLRDTLGITAYAAIANTPPPMLMEHYRSNHFIWDRSLSNSQSFRFGGILEFPRTGTAVNVGAETLTNYAYFGADALPAQHSGAVQLFWVKLTQPLTAGPLHWDNTITYQATSDDAVVPLPALALRSNLYFTFRIARVLRVQLGLDCDYYTRYKAPSYQPATMAFYNQQEATAGNYPFMNLYANMHLGRARFYLMMSHINQGMTGTGYFSMPHYPMNPRRFQLGISVDFAD